MSAADDNKKTARELAIKNKRGTWITIYKALLDEVDAKIAASKICDCGICDECDARAPDDADSPPRNAITDRRCLYCQTGEVEKCICEGLTYPQPPALPASVVALIAAVRAWDFSNNHHPACGCQDCAINHALAAVDAEASK